MNGEGEIPHTDNDGYGKRPLWQWIIIYIIIGALVYGIIYYLVIAPRGGSSTSGGSSPQTQTPSY